MIVLEKWSVNVPGTPGPYSALGRARLLIRVPEMSNPLDPQSGDTLKAKRCWRLCRRGQSVPPGANRIVHIKMPILGEIAHWPATTRGNQRPISAATITRKRPNSRRSGPNRRHSAVVGSLSARFLSLNSLNQAVNERHETISL
jgi:hypothetical protein